MNENCVYCGTHDGQVRECRCMNDTDIKKKKQEVIEMMKPVWDENIRLYNEDNKVAWQHLKNRLKCYWSYPWGHIYSDWEGPRYFERRHCMVCNHIIYKHKGLS